MRSINTAQLRAAHSRLRTASNQLRSASIKLQSDLTLLERESRQAAQRAHNNAVNMQQSLRQLNTQQK